MDNNDKIDINPILSKYELKYIKLSKNYGLSLGRNMGIKFSKGNIVIFLDDDDAIPAHNFVEQHVKAHNEYDILGLRGKTSPRTASAYNYLQSHYDLGDKIIPCPINLEGKSSFNKKILIEIGGFNPEIQQAGGHKGIELTYRIIRKYKDISKLVYYPGAIIYHDYSDSFFKYIKKKMRHNKYLNMLECLFPDILVFAQVEKKLSNQEFVLEKKYIEGEQCCAYEFMHIYV